MYFGVAIAGIVTFVGWTMFHRMELVRKDYYEHEILFQKQIDAKSRTAALGTQVVIAFEGEHQTLRLRVPPAHVRAGLQGTAQLYRPNDSHLDERIKLEPNQAGEQAIRKRLAPGLWRVSIEWTVNSSRYFHEEAIIAGEQK